MNENLIIFSTFLIFAGAAILSTAALYTRQALLVAYIFLGLLLGPWGLKFVSDINVIHKVGNIGIIFLLFLLGLNLNPKDLLRMFKETTWIVLITSLVFLIIGFFISYEFGFSRLDSLFISIALMFSSTIVSLKLLPSKVMRKERAGELIISILLAQDLLAVIVLLFLDFATLSNLNLVKIGEVIFALPLLCAFAFLFTRFVLMKLFAKFYHTQEYVFLLAIAWCLSFAEFARIFGLSYEIGAFIAGVTIATGPIALRIYENLKPLRDFFLILFFFSIGASFNIQILPKIFLPLLMLTMFIILVKPLLFKILLHRSGEPKTLAWEVGLRLGQASCFSLLIAQLAQHDGLLSAAAAQLVQATTTLTFIISSYIVVLLYPTPLAVSKELREE